MGEDEMDVSDNIQIVALKEKFLQKCFTIVEKGVEDGVFKMKDVAGCLGISSQVASKLVNPTSPRILTAFELFRMSVLVRRPVMEMIPLDLYLTAPELEDTHLCKALCAGTSDLPKSGPVRPHALHHRDHPRNRHPHGCPKLCEGGSGFGSRHHIAAAYSDDRGSLFRSRKSIKKKDFPHNADRNIGSPGGRCVL